MKYFLHIAYKGTNYSGWQRQPNAPSIQETLEQSLAKMLGYSISCIGCGRTDAGVHASQFFCHIILKEELSYDPIFRINKMLPNDIVVYDFIAVHRAAQAQFDALNRTYTYLLHRKRNPFKEDLSTFIDRELNIDKMKLAATFLPGKQDFRAFCKQPDIYKTTICEVKEAYLKQEGQQLVFTITANRFLRGMVRLLVGNLLEIGKDTLTLEQFRLALDEQQPLPYFNMAYPQGLYLSKVQYAYLDITPDS